MRRKFPLYVGNIGDSAVVQKAPKKLLRQAYLGSVDVASMGGPAQEKFRSELDPLLHAHGFHFRRPAFYRRLYGHADYTVGAGSIDPHEDGSYGHMALVLLAQAPLSRKLISNWPGDECQLHASNTWQPLDVGDVVIFNADYTHAWLANCRWLLATFQVSRT